MMFTLPVLAGTFLEIFDGKDLGGWQQIWADKGPAVWEIVDDELRAESREAYTHLLTTGDKEALMLTNFKLLLSAVLLLNLILPVFSFQPSDGVLVLDGEDDYAILPLAKHGYIFPRNTDEFTVEVWFYPKAEANPEPAELNIILSQQVRFGLLPDNRCRGKLDEHEWCHHQWPTCCQSKKHLYNHDMGANQVGNVLNLWKQLPQRLNQRTLRKPFACYTPRTA